MWQRLAALLGEHGAEHDPSMPEGLPGWVWATMGTMVAGLIGLLTIVIKAQIKRQEEDAKVRDRDPEDKSVKRREFEDKMDMILEKIATGAAANREVKELVTTVYKQLREEFTLLHNGEKMDRDALRKELEILTTAFRFHQRDVERELWPDRRQGEAPTKFYHRSPRNPEDETQP